MIPYKPPQIKQKSFRQGKLKSIPSMQLVYTLNSLCEGTENSYDSKNHILTINDIGRFQIAIQEKFNRSLKSFERQLKMLGFKVRRQRQNQFQNSKENINIPKIYKWKGKKQLLIDQQLNNIQKGLKQRRTQMEETRRIINSHKNYIDNQIESTLFSLIVDFSSQKSHIKLNQILLKTRAAINESQFCLRKMISRISGTLSNELQLYKLLIYKEGNSEKRANQKQDQGDGGNDNANSEQSQQKAVIEEEDDSKKSSLVSIQMEQVAKDQLQMPKVQ